MPDERAARTRALDSDTAHSIKNHLAMIVGFCELLLAETLADDARYADMQEINRAARTSMAIFRRDPSLMAPSRL